MATIKKNATLKTSQTKNDTKTKSQINQKAEELHYILVNPLFTPIEITKEYYEELKKGKITETKNENIIYVRVGE